MALTTTPPRRSARLGIGKRARASDSEQQQLPPSSSKSPEHSPRWIRAQKRQKILVGPSETRAGKRKSLVPDDEQQHLTVVRKKRKENAVNDPTAKISITLDTRLGDGNNLHHRHWDEIPHTRSKSTPDSKLKSKAQDQAVSKRSCLPSLRMMTRTMKKLSSFSVITKTILPSASPIPSSSQSTIVPHAAHSTATPTITDTSTSTISPSTDTTPPPFSKSPIPISMSFMNVPLSVPPNLPFLNMPLTMPLPMSLPISSDMLAPSESELGFGFQPQEEFNSTVQQGSKGKEKDAEHVFTNGEQPQTTNESMTTGSSPDRSSPPLNSPQSCLIPISPTATMIPPRLVISTCASDQSQPSPTSPTSPTYPSFTNPTSPTYSSPLKAVCFPAFPGAPVQSSPPVSQQLPTLPLLTVVNEDEDRIHEWDMDMGNDQRRLERSLEQEMSMELSFGSSSTRQGALEGLEEDRSPLLGPVPQPSSSQPPPFPPSLPSCSLPTPPCSSTTSCSPSSSSRQYHKKIEYHQMPEWTPKLDKERSLWKLACKIRVWEITKRYTPDTIRTVVAQEAHDYYSVHGFPLGYGSVPVRSRKRRWRKMVGGGSTAALTAPGSESSSCSSMMVTTPSPSPPPSATRDDEFMSEETYSFELMDDDDDLDASVGGVDVGIRGIRSMEDEWRYEEFEDDGFGFEDYDDDDDDDDDTYEEDEVEEGHAQMFGNRKKNDVQSFTTGDDQDPDPDAEGEMEIDIEPFQDPSFNAELSSPTSPTSSASSMSKSESSAVLGNESQSFVSSFYIPPIPPHVQHMMQMQQLQRQEEQHQRQQLDEPLALPPSLSSTEGTPISTSDAAEPTTTAPSNTPMQIHLPPAPPLPLHCHPQHIQLSPNILPLPPPRLNSIRVFILRHSEMGGLRTTGRGTPADRKRGAIWGGTGGGESKRWLNDGKESESQCDSDESGTRGRPRLRLMLSDHDTGSEPRRACSRQGEGVNGAKMVLRLSLPCDTEERMPIVPTGFECDISESSNPHKDEDIHRIMPKPSSSTTSTFIATDQTWDAFLASLDDKSQPRPQGEEGILDTSVTAADGDTTNGQLQLDLDGLRHRPTSERDPLGSLVRRLGPSSTLEGSSGMFIFDQGPGGDSSSSWFGGGDGVNESGLGKSGVGVGVGGLVGSSGSCPSDALALEGFNFPVGPDGSSTLSYAIG